MSRQNNIVWVDRDFADDAFGTLLDNMGATGAFVISMKTMADRTTFMDTEARPKVKDWKQRQYRRPRR